jgi:hypothetical protein
VSNRHQRRVAMSESRKRRSWEWQELPIALASGLPALRNIKRAVRNDFWIVQMYEFDCATGHLQHLMIRSVEHPNGPDSGHEPRWVELQRIKNELCGPDFEAVQVYPRQADVMDQADMYHLFVLPPGAGLPFGLHRECGFMRG